MPDVQLIVETVIQIQQNVHRAIGVMNWLEMELMLESAYAKLVFAASI